VVVEEVLLLVGVGARVYPKLLRAVLCGRYCDFEGVEANAADADEETGYRDRPDWAVGGSVAYAVEKPSDEPHLSAYSSASTQILRLFSQLTRTNSCIFGFSQLSQRLRVMLG